MSKVVKKYKYEILAFLFSFLVGCLVILPNTILGKGLFFLGADLNLHEACRMALEHTSECLEES